MATYTRHLSPCGPLTRSSHVVDGETYDVVRSDLYPGRKRRYDLRRHAIPGPPEAHIFVEESRGGSIAMMAEAVARLLGVR
jgi:hypothetical protein